MLPNIFDLFRNHSHLSRKYRGVDLDAAYMLPDHDHNNVASGETSAEPRMLETVFEEEQMHSIQGMPLQTANHTEKSAALFLLTLKERYQITQSALDFAVW